MLKVSDLRYQIGPQILLQANFSVGPKDRLWLRAPSGTGKTTLLRLLAGLERPDQGKILLEGIDLTPIPPERRKVGFVFQEQALFPHLNVLDNVSFGLRMRGQGRKARDAEALRWLDAVGLPARGRDAVGNLSGGEKQRVAIARALICEPALVLLDEPWTGLDTNNRRALQTLLIDLHGRRPAPWIYVSHDKGEDSAETFATQTLDVQISNEGKVRSFGQ